jgi:hypothetical protein
MAPPLTSSSPGLSFNFVMPGLVQDKPGHNEWRGYF